MHTKPKNKPDAQKENIAIDDDTIVAQSTPSGRGGIAIVRISGSLATSITEKIIGQLPQPRLATLSTFYDQSRQQIDSGIVLYFKKPYSFTGEDVVEFHGHGGPVVVDQLIKVIIALGARLARPGEFTERAFLNDKLDLAQAEAIADLIDASSKEAARSALSSLQGEFSKTIHELLDEVIALRVYIEAAIDFPEEEIDFISHSTIEKDISSVIHFVEDILKNAKQGVLLREGIHVVIAGEPNVGKSSLLNQLSGDERAIVTDIAGTTRDILRETIHIDGMPVHISDTAGLRDSHDVVEQEGIRRAQQVISQANLVLYVVDTTREDQGERFQHLCKAPDIVIRNKIDLISEEARVISGSPVVISLSAKTGMGVDLLRAAIKKAAGLNQTTQGKFMARRRHIDALKRVHHALKTGLNQLRIYNAPELVAEDLRHAQRALGEITGEFTSDDLLGKIFSEFCIGK